MAQLELLSTFVAIYRLGTLTQAAHERHLTQPAISHQLAALERAARAPLFVRTPHGVIPTEKGRTLYNEVFESVDKLERVKQGMRLVSPNPQTLHLGMAAEYFTGFALERLADVENDLVLTFGSPDVLIPKLEEGILDAVVSTQKPNSNALQQHSLLLKHYLLVGSPKVIEPLSDNAAVEAVAAYLGQQAWVSYSLDFPVTRRFWSQVLKATFRARKRLITPDLQAIKHAVELGMGVSILPEYLCAEAIQTGRLVEVWPVRDRIPAERWILAHRVMDSEREDIRTVAERLSVPHRTVN